MILRVGLTGGLASGKSTVADTLAGLGCFVVDADEVVSDLYRRGASGYEALVRKYGKEILDQQGEIDRERLSLLALADDIHASELNRLIHPLVAEKIEQILRNEEARFPGRDRIAVVEATLLLEAGNRERYDTIVVADVDPEEQVRRAVGRGLDEAEARKRIARQMSREQRLRHAGHVIDTSGDLRSTEVQTHRLFTILREELERKEQPPAK
ncbi:MAG TPA: dephospho-CoA kinase [Thermoanaerobaculia bacterium]|nr:dephospho-CoA kinase [Thermoanaerobaculia bacterium]